MFEVIRGSLRAAMRRTDTSSCARFLALAVLAVVAAACGVAPTGASGPTVDTAVAAEAVRTIDSAWIGLAQMPTARNAFGVAALDGQIYVAGGWARSPSCANAADSCWSAALESYDPRTDSWTVRASLLTPRNSFALAAARGRLYAFGGYTEGGLTASVEEYDPTTDT